MDSNLKSAVSAAIRSGKSWLHIEGIVSVAMIDADNKEHETAINEAYQMLSDARGDNDEENS